MTNLAPLPGQQLGWKVMRTNPEGTQLISGAMDVLFSPPGSEGSCKCLLPGYDESRQGLRARVLPMPRS